VHKFDTSKIITNARFSMKNYMYPAWPYYWWYQNNAKWARAPKCLSQTFVALCLPIRTL